MTLPAGDYPVRLPRPFRVDVGRRFQASFPMFTSTLVDGVVVTGPQIDWTGVGDFIAQARPDLDPMSTPASHMVVLDFEVTLVAGTPVLTLTSDQTAQMLPERATFWSFELAIVSTGQSDLISIASGTLIPQRGVIW